MSAGQIALVVVILTASAVLSAVAGFGFGLMSVPLMAMTVTVRQAVVLSSMMGFGVTCVQAWQWRRFAVRPIVARVSVPAYLGMPLGLWLFVHVDARWLKLALGVAILVAVGLLLVRIDLRRSGPRLDVTAGFLSGVLNTSLSTNGPPLVFLLQARRLEPDPFRGTLSVIFVISSVAGLTLFAARGYVTGSALVTVAATLPAVLAGLYAGGRIRPRVDAARFRILVLVLLGAAGIMSIATA